MIEYNVLIWEWNNDTPDLKEVETFKDKDKAIARAKELPSDTNIFKKVTQNRTVMEYEIDKETGEETFYQEIQLEEWE